MGAIKNKTLKRLFGSREKDKMYTYVTTGNMCSKIMLALITRR